MAHIAVWRFGPFRLDTASGCLWHGEMLVPLRPKPYALLAYLVLQAGQVVSKEMLLEQVWPKTVVSDGVLKDYINQIRKTIGDTARAPQYIATVHRRGYRFIAPVTAEDSISPPQTTGHVAQIPPEMSQRTEVAVHDVLGRLVAREEELAQLQQWWPEARRGERRIVFLTGEVGIGKTTLVDAFVAQLGDTAESWVAHGQCVEQHGAGEAYLPLLEALGRLGRDPHGGQFLELLRQQAPSWLVHVPALLSASQTETFQRHSGATRERMLRELAEAVEAFTSTHPLLLVLEDLHWSDAATVEWLAYMARRRGTARLLVLGTYRPLEAMLQAHPVRRIMHDLLLHGLGLELTLRGWSEADVTAYLTRRLGGEQLPAGLDQALHQRTGGNPFFSVAMVDELLRQGLLRAHSGGWELVEGLDSVTTGVPESLRQLIEQQLEQLRVAEQTLLEAASVVGREFSAAAAAATMGQEVLDIEAHCEVLAHRGQFLRPSGTEEWPDGTVSTRYGFLHDLYRETCYERIPVSRRMSWHRRVGARLEAAYGSQSPTIAAVLAAHFVRGREPLKAVQYLQLAGDNALRRSAHQEAITHLTAALEWLTALPEGQQRIQQELDLLVSLGPALIATKSQAAREVEDVYARARDLCAQVGETPQLSPTLQGLCEFYRNRGALQTARELGMQLYRLASSKNEPTSLIEVHVALGTTLFHLGDYAAARTHLESGLALTDPAAWQPVVLRRDALPGVRCLALLANTLWCLGFPDLALRHSHQALSPAADHPYSLAMAHHFAAFLHLRRGEAKGVQAHAEALISLARAQGFPLYVAYATCYQGWVLSKQGHAEEGLMLVQQGLDALIDMGLELSRPLWSVLLAEMMGDVDQLEAGLQLLDEALTAFKASGRGDMLAEAYRLKGELLLRLVPPEVVRAEGYFQRALEVAQRQMAKSWELRAAISLSRLWQSQGAQAEPRALLTGICEWFAEGFDTADLRAAKALVDDLAG